MKITLNRGEIENALLNVVREKMVATSETIEEDGHHFEIYDQGGNEVEPSEINFVVHFV
jgi:hypothetical protein